MIPGLVLVGQALQKHLIWVGIMFGWGIFVVGVMIASVVSDSANPYTHDFARRHVVANGTSNKVIQPLMRQTRPLQRICSTATPPVQARWEVSLI